MNNNRNNRRRGRGNRNSGGGNSQNRIDSRARGNAPQLLDKYKKLAQDAQHNGDRVQAEYYLQFADHYFRVIADNKARQEEARAKRNEERGQASEDGDDEDGDNRRRNNRRSRGRRDDQEQDVRETAAPEEGEQGVEGEAVGDDEAAKPARRGRKPKSADAGDKPTRGSRSNGKGRRNSDGAGGGEDAGEIDSAVLPPAFSSSDSSDDDDDMEAVS